MSELIAQHAWCGWLALACLLFSVWPWWLANRAANQFDELCKLHAPTAEKNARLTHQVQRQAAYIRDLEGKLKSYEGRHG